VRSSGNRASATARCARSNQPADRNSIPARRESDSAGVCYFGALKAMAADFPPATR
jgi:hypothetical protein